MSEVVRFYDEDEPRISDVATAYDIAHAMKSDVDILERLFDSLEFVALKETDTVFTEDYEETRYMLEEERLMLSDILGREVTNSEHKRYHELSLQLLMFNEEYSDKVDEIRQRLDSSIARAHERWMADNQDVLLLRRLAREVDVIEDEEL